MLLLPQCSVVCTFISFSCLLHFLIRNEIRIFPMIRKLGYLLYFLLCDDHFELLQSHRILQPVVAVYRHLHMKRVCLRKPAVILWIRIHISLSPRPSSQCSGSGSQDPDRRNRTVPLDYESGSGSCSFLQ
jgi:hypothetical protein